MTEKKKKENNGCLDIFEHMDRRNEGGGSVVLLAENEILSNLMKIGNKDKQCLIDNKIRYETMIF